jgi:predicted ATPase/class 3 adenylate cyclase/DNA-binding CsgD family transcriptional regulator
MLASMSEIDPRADAPLLNWGELAMDGLVPTGTVTLLLADVEGSTRLWESQPEQMTAAIAQLDRTVCDIIADHDGVRPVEQGEGDSFVVAFARASDAVACALELQRALWAPIRLRIGMHTGEVQLRDEANYIGPTINRAARLRDLAHGGQTVMSGATEELVAERLPDGAWLSNLGTHMLRDLPRPERVVQLCHPDLVNDFPPLRVSTAVVSQHLPVQLTSFVGRGAEGSDVRQLVCDNRLVTLTGAGGVGKTRLAIQVADQLAGGFGGGAWYVDLAPITDPELVPLAAARALGLPDQPGRSTMDTLTRFVADRRMLIVLDNCEHLLDASAALVNALLGACTALSLLATSREPIGVPGEVSWRVPSLSLADEAAELFADRARHARPDFTVGDEDAAAVGEICARLDGIPLAIELAAARVRALSLPEILDGLHDRFRLLTGGARTALRRQQTLRASVDWSHALLTETERVVFRRLSVFIGGFDLEAAQAVCGSDHVARYHVLDQLTLLVDKSLVVAEERRAGMRYRLLETVRQYAAEKLGESGEAEAVRTRHRDHYTAVAARLDAPAQAGHEQRLEQAEIEIDNLRAAFRWSLEHSHIEFALALASSLQPLWLTRGRIQEGLAWFDTALTDLDARHIEIEVAAAVRARALADKTHLDGYLGIIDTLDWAEHALAIAREVGDTALLARTLTTYGFIAGQGYDREAARACFAEAIGLARALDDRWRLSQILSAQAVAAHMAGDALAVRAAAEEGRDLADPIGDRFNSCQCRQWLASAQLIQGDLAGALTQFNELAAEAKAAHDEIGNVVSLNGQSVACGYRGEVAAARAAAEAVLDAGAELGGRYAVLGHVAVGRAALAAGDVAAAHDAHEAARPHTSVGGATAALRHVFEVETALADGDLDSARRRADEAVSTTTGWWLMLALTDRARVSIAAGELEPVEHDAHDALALGAGMRANLLIPDILECLAIVAGESGSHREAARLFGAAQAFRLRIGVMRFKIYDAGYQAAVAVLREAMGERDFDAAWAEGAALSTEEAIGYAQRGRGERKRPSSGWESLTPTELDVVRLVGEGLVNKDIATRLFVSPRTVQTHLTHVYTKLGLASRVQLVQEAARHA